MARPRCVPDHLLDRSEQAESIPVSQDGFRPIDSHAWCLSMFNRVKGLDVIDAVSPTTPYHRRRRVHHTSGKQQTHAARHDLTRSFDQHQRRRRIFGCPVDIQDCDWLVTNFAGVVLTPTSPTETQSIHSGTSSWCSARNRVSF